MSDHYALGLAAEKEADEHIANKQYEEGRKAQSRAQHHYQKAGAGPMTWDHSVGDFDDEGREIGNPFAFTPGPRSK